MTHPSETGTMGCTAPRRTLLLIALLLATSAGCGNDNATALGPTEDCFNGVDDDGDGDIDCADLDCQGHAACSPFHEYLCDNGVDDDGDEKVDCNDPDCAEQQVCNPDREVACADGVDNDGDTLVDCRDPDCQPEGACQEQCTDQVDNDLDGFTDCDDSDCAEDPACTAGVELACRDGVDNDEDGKTDCDDPDCDEAPACLVGPEPEICDDGVDNDGDGAVDCQDTDCAANGHCVEYACADGVDNDGDGAVDCRDTDCHGPGLCQTDPTCQAATPIQCGDTITDFNRGLPNTWSTYPCLSGHQFLGGERIYLLTGASPYSGDVDVAVAADDTTTQIALISFGGAGGQCEPSTDCLSALSGPEDPPELQLTLANSDVFIVVDTVQAAGDDFTLTVSCNTPIQEICDNDNDDDGDQLEDCWDPDCQTDSACNHWITGGVICDPQDPITCAPGESCRLITVAGTNRNDGVCTRTCVMGNPDQCYNDLYPFGACVTLPSSDQVCVQQCGTSVMGWSSGDCPPDTVCTDIVNGTTDPYAGACVPTN